MKIKILGGGWYGCHLALALRAAGHEIELHEAKDELFLGASGANPARLHLGFHYPRSRLTRAMCQEHQARFLDVYGFLTRAIPVNIYAVAARDSLVDFGTYKQVLQGEVQFIPIHNPEDFGLRNVEGAVLTGERHIVIPLVREYFSSLLEDVLHLHSRPDPIAPEDGWVIDCTFCSNDATGIDRYEPCVIGLVSGSQDNAVTIMDGPFPSLYPWFEGLNSITSAKWTPLSKAMTTYVEAAEALNELTKEQAHARIQLMIDDLAHYWPRARLLSIVTYRTAIRALPRSGADARLVEVHHERGSRMIRVRAGKIDAIFHAERLVKEIIGV